MNSFCDHKRDRHVVIIGNGIAGITCARYLRKKDHHARITIISGETPHFFSRTALMYLYMGHMKFEHIKPYEDWFWEKNRLNLIHDWVTHVDLEHKTVSLGNEQIAYDILVIATGSTPRMFDYPGMGLQGVQGLYSYQDLQLMEKNTRKVRHAVVVGGGLIGIELAEMLKSRNIAVTMLVREKNYWDNVLPKEEARLINRHIREHDVNLRLGEELKAVEGDNNGRVSQVMVSSGEKIACQFVGISIGVKPNIDLFRETELDTGEGIITDGYFRTNIENVFAVGDCVEFKETPGRNRKNIEQVWYTGRMHGETLAYNLTSHQPVRYKPGVWFNSAKFFDIEYQTYGYVPPVDVEGQKAFYWEHPGGKMCFRMQYEEQSKAVLGINSLGIRWRHAYFDKAIKEGRHIDRVMQELEEANFNPEFFEPYHGEIVATYNHEFGTAIKTTKPTFLSRLFN